MSQSKAKEIRKLEQQAVKTIYELTIKIFSNGQVSVTSNDNQAIDDPIIYTQICLDADRAVSQRWVEQRKILQQKINADGGSRIILPGS